MCLQGWIRHESQLQRKSDTETLWQILATRRYLCRKKCQEKCDHTVSTLCSWQMHECDSSSSQRMLHCFTKYLGKQNVTSSIETSVEQLKKCPKMKPVIFKSKGQTWRCPRRGPGARLTFGWLPRVFSDTTGSPGSIAWPRLWSSRLSRWGGWPRSTTGPRVSLTDPGRWSRLPRPWPHRCQASLALGFTPM